MKLLILAFVLTVTSMANAAEPKDLALFQKLESLYNTSTTPYPVANTLVTTGAEVSPFTGCTTADSSGKTDNLPVYNFVKYQITAKAGNGPLSPAVIKYGYAFLSNSAKDLGRVLKNGIVDFDAQDFSEKMRGLCNDGTTKKDLIINTQEGLSADGTAFELKSKCNNNAVRATHSFKLAQNYLVLKMTISNDKDSISGYMYCW